MPRLARLAWKNPFDSEEASHLRANPVREVLAVPLGNPSDVRWVEQRAPVFRLVGFEWTPFPPKLIFWAQRIRITCGHSGCFPVQGLPISDGPVMLTPDQ